MKPAQPISDTSNIPCDTTPLNLVTTNNPDTLSPSQARARRELINDYRDKILTQYETLFCNNKHKVQKAKVHIVLKLIPEGAIYINKHFADLCANQEIRNLFDELCLQLEILRIRNECSDLQYRQLRLSEISLQGENSLSTELITKVYEELSKHTDKGISFVTFDDAGFNIDKNEITEKLNDESDLLKLCKLAIKTSDEKLIKHLIGEEFSESEEINNIIITPVVNKSYSHVETSANGNDYAITMKNEWELPPNVGDFLRGQSYGRDEFDISTKHKFRSAIYEHLEDKKSKRLGINPEFTLNMHLKNLHANRISKATFNEIITAYNQTKQQKWYKSLVGLLFTTSSETDDVYRFVRARLSKLEKQPQKAENATLNNQNTISNASHDDNEAIAGQQNESLSDEENQAYREVFAAIAQYCQQKKNHHRDFYKSIKKRLGTYGMNLLHNFKFENEFKQMENIVENCQQSKRRCC